LAEIDERFAVPADQSARPERSGRAKALPHVAAFAAAGVILFCAYPRLAQTDAENSDMANILLMASDMLHGNVLLSGWHVSDVSFYTTELPQYALLESFLGVHMATAQVAAAMTYTLTLLLAVLLAKGSTSGRDAALRVLIVGAIMLAPQLGGAYTRWTWPSGTSARRFRFCSSGCFWTEPDLAGGFRC
jgi:hypothetical protein